MSQAQRDWQSHSVEGVFLRFIVHENRQHHGELVYEWLLRQAKKLGLHGGSAFKGIAGFGRHGILHEQHFFELQGDLPVEVRFVCSAEEVGRLLDVVEKEKLSIFYVISSARYGIAGAEKANWPDAFLPLA